MNKLKNQELLNRIKKLEALTKRLEQAIQDIWASFSCLDDLPKDETIYCPGPPDEIEEELPEEIDHD